MATAAIIGCQKCKDESNANHSLNLVKKLCAKVVVIVVIERHLNFLLLPSLPSSSKIGG
jgi:hypothetical protein